MRQELALKLWSVRLTWIVYHTIVKMPKGGALVRLGCDVDSLLVAIASSPNRASSFGSRAHFTNDLVERAEIWMRRKQNGRHVLTLTALC
jgi:hypothetical protein